MTMHGLPKLSLAAQNLKPGLYRHFKGGDYEVIGVGRDSEDPTNELVVYRKVDTGERWVRPLENFLATIERDGYSGPRFTYLK